MITPVFLSQDKDFLAKKKVGDKINYMDIVNEVAYRTMFSSYKVNQILNYYNNILKDQINKGNILYYPNLFYFGYQLKNNKRNNLIEIFDDFVDLTKINKSQIPHELILQLNLAPQSIIKIIDTYNRLFKQLFLTQKYNFSYLQLCYIKNVNHKVIGLRSLEMFYTKPDKLIFMVTNGREQWLQTFDNNKFQINFHLKN